MEIIIKDNINTIFEQEKIDGNTSTNFDLLIKYFETLDEEGKVIFKSIIQGYINQVSDKIASIKDIEKVSGNGRLYIKVILYFGFGKRFIDNMQGKSSKIYSLFESYKDFLGTFEGDERNILATRLDSVINGLDASQFTNYVPNPIHTIKREISQKILKYKIENIQYTVNQIDIEIKGDQEKVIELIKEFGFNEDLNNYLTKLGNTNILAMNDIDFAGTIATYRDFFGKIIIEIANKISSIKNESIPDYTNEQGNKLTPIGTARKYIKESLLLSKNENNLIDNFVEVLHTQGGHNLFASQIYFRMTKNIGIELIYMLLSKTQSMQK